MTSASEAATSVQPLCPRHPSRAAVGTCTRCGRYVCSRCLRDAGFCPECIVQSVAGIPSSAPRARWAEWFLRLAAGAGAGTLILSIWALQERGVNETREDIAGLVSLMMLVIVVGTPIVFLRWLHRVVRQLEAWGRDVGATPGWAVGYWFIPFVNLVKPFRIVRSIVTELGGESLEASLHLGMWWGALIFTRILGRLEERLSRRVGLDGLPPDEAYMAGIGSSLCFLVAAVLCLRIVRAVQERIDERRAGVDRGEGW